MGQLEGIVRDITRFGYIRNTHDESNHYKFYDVDKKLRSCDWSAGAFPPFDFVPGIVHMLDDKPVCLKDLVKRMVDYNSQQQDDGFNILDVPRLLLAGIEIGAISVVRIEDEGSKIITCTECRMVVLEDEIEGGWRGDLWYCVSCRRDDDTEVEAVQHD